MRHTHVALLVLALLSCGRQPPAESDNSDGELVHNRGEGKDDWWDALPRPAWGEFEKIEQSQDWFEVYEIRDGLFAIYEPGQSRTSSSARRKRSCSTPASASET